MSIEDDIDEAVANWEGSRDAMTTVALDNTAARFKPGGPVVFEVPPPRRYTVTVWDSTGIHILRLVEDEANLVRALRRAGFWGRWWHRFTRRHVTSAR